MASEYQRMENAIRYIEEHTVDQPTLEEVAGHVGLSPFHFQRQFKKWTGVSPKRFAQFLTVRHAKKLLDGSASVLETACEVGLSGTSRLHDLFVSVEAVTPGQYRTGGAGVVLRYGFHPTPFGLALIVLTARGITDLWFVDEDGRQKALEELAAMWPAAEIREDPDDSALMLNRIFDTAAGVQGERIRLEVRGTNFQVKVWQALLQIPEGTIVSYSGLAGRVGRPDAVRAVAGAVARNPVAWLIPCHRVLRSSGQIGGYRWGVARKRMMLARELGGAEL